MVAPKFLARVDSLNRLFLSFTIILLLSVFCLINPLSVKNSFETTLLRAYGDEGVMIKATVMAMDVEVAKMVIRVTAILVKAIIITE